MNDIEWNVACFCLYEEATTDFAPLLFSALHHCTPLAIVAGPEGGFSQKEVSLACERGWTPVSLGPSILRTETAAAAVLRATPLFRQN
ncbi:RsmE family RNA methyltransferase [Pajaroellobacter abortibovis]|uniref:RsmE family RNA methyltransferase n=1 Tax=Pajaroellobacter abortibovis TaxID=1882918 RepID=UPI00094B5B00|nr:RsmE family RNA methyltransferase [Pajaroellobacter abortibovis]